MLHFFKILRYAFKQRFHSDNAYYFNHKIDL